MGVTLDVVELNGIFDSGWQIYLSWGLGKLLHYLCMKFSTDQSVATVKGD